MDIVDEIQFEDKSKKKYVIRFTPEFEIMVIEQSCERRENFS